MLLHYACDVGATRCIKHLVDVCGANLNATDNRGCNAVMHSLYNNIDLIEYLVSKGECPAAGLV